MSKRILSNKKRAAQSLIRRASNRARISRVKTAIKKFDAAVLVSNGIDTASTLFVKAQSELARAFSKGVIKKNKMARKVSKLAAKLKKAVVQ